MKKFEQTRVGERERLVRLLELENAIKTKEVRQAFLDVPRHYFVPESLQDLAYANNAQPIGLGQTISQPLIVALMTELLEPDPDKTILEIGTGSGYQAAILSRIVKKVYSVERISELSRTSVDLFRKLEYTNIECCVGDGTLGWAEHAPFDGIIVTAGSPRVPMSLKQQLNDGGILVIPVGEHGYQVLKRIRRDGDHFIEETHGGCIFVKLIGKEAWGK